MPRPDHEWLPGAEAPPRDWVRVCVSTLLGLCAALGMGVLILLVLALLLWR
jgi:hypothetical protein